MEKEQEYKIGANAYEFVQKHRSYLSHVQQAELQAMLKDFAIEQVKNSVVLADVSGALLSDNDYWKQRCLLAEQCLEESPCDPDITADQINAWNAYHKFISLVGNDH